MKVDTGSSNSVKCVGLEAVAEGLRWVRCTILSKLILVNVVREQGRNMLDDTTTPSLHSSEY